MTPPLKRPMGRMQRVPMAANVYPGPPPKRPGSLLNQHKDKTINKEMIHPVSDDVKRLLRKYRI